MFAATRCGLMSTKSGPWDLSSAVYSGKSKSVSAQDSAPTGVTFSPDGLKMYVAGSTNNRINQYSLATAWDPASATFVNYKSVSAQVTAGLRGPRFSTDGTRMYILGASPTLGVFQFNLSTAWDVISASYFGYKSISAQESNQGVDLVLSPDGLKMFVFGITNYGRIWQYTLSTAWTVSTASYVQSSPALNTIDGTLRGGVFSPDGLIVYLNGGASNKLFQARLGTAWDASTLADTGKSASITTGASSYGLAVATDGTAIYLASLTGSSIYKYSMG